MSCGYLLRYFISPYHQQVNHKTKPDLTVGERIAQSKVRHLVNISRSHGELLRRTRASHPARHSRCDVLWLAHSQLHLLSAGLDVIAPFFGNDCVISVTHKADAAAQQLAGQCTVRNL